MFEGHLALFGRDQGFSQAWVHDLASGETAPIPFEEAVYVVAPGANWEFATTKLRLTLLLTDHPEHGTRD